MLLSGTGKFMMEDVEVRTIKKCHRHLENRKVQLAGNVEKYGYVGLGT